MRDFDSNLLRTFVTVVETGTVSAAATRLSRTQAAISMQMRRLEDDVGRALLERTPRGMLLTEAGSRLLPYAHAILGAGEDARRNLAAEGIAGTVRLGMLEDVAAGRLPYALRRFSVAHPQISLDMVVDTSSTLAERFLEGTLDVLIADPAMVDAKPEATWSQPLFWFGARGYPATREDLLPIVAFDGICPWQEQVFAILRRRKIAWRVVCTSTSLPAIQSAVEAGLGVSVLLEGGIRHHAMRVLGAAEGLPRAPAANLGLFVRNTVGLHGSAIEALRTLLFEELVASR